MLGRIAEGLIDLVDRAVYTSGIYACVERARFRSETRSAAKAAGPSQQTGSAPFAKDTLERK